VGYLCKLSASWQAKQIRLEAPHRQGGVQAAKLERLTTEQGGMPRAGKPSPILHLDIPHVGFQAVQMGVEADR
jgi:hypothetical protein